MRDLIPNPEWGWECPRHGLMFMVHHEVLILERTWDDEAGEFETTDSEPAGSVVVYCDACDDNVPEEERSWPHVATRHHLELPDARDLMRTAGLVGNSLNLHDPNNEYAD